MESEQILSEFEILEENSNFVSKSFKTLQREYPGKYIAVEDGKVLVSADSFEGLYKKIVEMGKSLREVMVEFIPKEGIIVLY